MSCLMVVRMPLDSLVLPFMIKATWLSTLYSQNSIPDDPVNITKHFAAGHFKCPADLCKPCRTVFVTRGKTPDYLVGSEP